VAVVVLGRSDIAVVVAVGIAVTVLPLRKGRFGDTIAAAAAMAVAVTVVAVMTAAVMTAAVMAAAVMIVVESVEPLEPPYYSG
jgi:hypothetical protein